MFTHSQERAMPPGTQQVAKVKAALCAAVVATALVAGLTTDQASGMTPAQTTESGVVNLLGGYTAGYTGGSIDDFWRRTLPSWGASYSKPAVRYYGNGSGGYYNTACGSTYPLRGENGMYCPANGTIYLDYWGQQGLLNRLGDHGSGGFLAHEWAHRAQHHLGTLGYADFRLEYNADCMAGLYTRYGYSTGRLSGNDFWEFYNWLYYLSSSASHGTGANRAEWFRYGYNQYTKGACDQTFTLTASGASASSTASGASTHLKPPRSARVDLTPPASKALPVGSKTGVDTRRDLKVRKTKPVS
jgi:predicted metalloprotease